MNINKKCQIPKKKSIPHFSLLVVWDINYNVGVLCRLLCKHMSTSGTESNLHMLLKGNVYYVS